MRLPQRRGPAQQCHGSLSLAQGSSDLRALICKVLQGTTRTSEVLSRYLLRMRAR